MDLNEYINKLIEFRDKDPNNGKLTVIYSRDDEGNGYQEVYYSPTPGILMPDNEFCSHEEDFEYYEKSKEDINAVCIN